MKVKMLTIYLGPKEYGNELMDKVAREAFSKDETLDVVQVHEHGGWFLSYLRDGTIVGTANDLAILKPKALDFIHSVEQVDYLPEIRRS